MVPPDAAVLDQPVDAPVARTTFPVFLPSSAHAFRDGPGACPNAIPWRVMERVAERARLFHSATLVELAERGGLDPREIQALFNGRKLTLGGSVTMHDGVEFVRSLQHGRMPELEPLKEGPKPAHTSERIVTSPPPKAAPQGQRNPSLPGYVPLQEAADAAGITIWNLRAWLDRHNWPPTHRSSSGYRYIPVALLPQVIQVAALVAKGRRIGSIIRDGIVYLTDPGPEPVATAAPPPLTAPATTAPATTAPATTAPATTAPVDHEPLPADELAESIPLLRSHRVRERWIDSRNRKLLARLYYLAMKAGPVTATAVAREVKVPDHVAAAWLHNNYLRVEEAGKSGRQRLWRWRASAPIPPPVEGGPDPTEASPSNASTPVSEPDPVPPPSAPAAEIVPPAAQEPVADETTEDGPVVYTPVAPEVAFAEVPAEPFADAGDPPTDRPVAVYRRSKGSIASGPAPAAPTDTVPVPKHLLETLLGAIEQHRAEYDLWTAGGTKYDQKIAWNRVTAAEKAAQAAMTELMAFAKYGAHLVPGKAPPLLPADIAWR